MRHVPFHNKQSLLVEVAMYGIRSALRPYLKSRRSAFVAVLFVPPTGSVSTYHDAANTLLEEAFGDSGQDEDWTVHYFGSLSGERLERELDRLEASRRTIVLLRERSILSRRLELSTDLCAELPAASSEHFAAAARRLGLKEMTSADAALLAASEFCDIHAAMTEGRPHLNAMRRLKTIAQARTQSAPVTNPEDVDPSDRRRSGPLESLVGLEELKEWAYALGDDIAAWRAGKLSWAEVDKGALLSGPPGTGKTRFAKAVADVCGMNFVATSAAQWQAAGHLGDYLKAMRAVFAQATSRTPCLILIDEFDAVGKRVPETSDNGHYHRQTVNGLLEALDGSDSREGVVVIGATNDGLVVDPALLRPGRLERIFTVDLPDEDARIAILCRLLDFCDTSELAQFGELSEGMSGADIEKIARDAKRCARRDGRAVRGDDLWAAMPPIRKLDEAELRSVAIHEAGHAVIGILVGVGRLDSVRISKVAFRKAGCHQPVGRTQFELPNSVIRGCDHYYDHMAMLMGGIAAEEVLSGYFGYGAGGMLGADLIMATDMATMVECQWGMGSTLMSEVGEGHRELRSLRFSNPGAWRRIDEMVRSQFLRAKQMIGDHTEIVDQLARQLILRGRMHGDEVLGIVRACDSRRSENGKESRKRTET